MFKKQNTFVLHSDYAEMIIKHKNQDIKIKIDLEDVDRVKELGRWHAIYDATLQVPSFYICHRKPNQRCYKLHRFLMNCPENMEIDHINHDTLDNRKSNLKICTRFENQQNLRSNKSGVVGVHFHNRGYWVAKITKNKKVYQKDFKTKEEAIKQRKEWEYQLFKQKEVA